jgi:hypothetical protein
MKRITILALLASAATTAAAAANDGTYSQGNTKTGSGVKMTVSGDRFSIKIVRFPETCHYGAKTIHEYFTFKSGTQAHLTGKVKASGAFSGKYVASAGQVKVSGTISGPAATIKATEGGPYNPASTVTPNACQGSRTFHAGLPTG